MLTSSPSHSPTIDPHGPMASSSSSTLVGFRCGGGSKDHGSLSSSHRHSLPIFRQSYQYHQYHHHHHPGPVASIGKRLSPGSGPGEASSVTPSSRRAQMATATEVVSIQSPLTTTSTSTSPRLTGPIPKTVDVGTQFVPPEKHQQQQSGSSGPSSTTVSLELGRIDLGRSGKRRAGSGSSQLSSTGEPRAPTLVPQMPGQTPPAPTPPAPADDPVESGKIRQKTPDPSSLSSSSSSSSHGSSIASSRLSHSKRARHGPRPVKCMPDQYDRCETKHLVRLISNMLMELVRFNDEIPLRDGRLTRFHSRAPPGISIQDYLQRLTTHATLSPPILLSMVYYIDRLCALYPAFIISSLTVHRFLIAAATVASKGLSDSFWTNATYARVGGISLRELALLEMEFLVRVQWRIVPKPEVLVDYYHSLVDRADGYVIRS